MSLSIIGISCHTAPVRVREQFALPGELARQLLRALHVEGEFEEALVLDTCNRTEVYSVPAGQTDPLAYTLAHVRKLKPTAPADTGGFYRYDGAEAVQHLFRVAAALDSQIVGEHQILGQLKEAYHLALQERTARFLLNKLMHRAFRVGKRVQSETALGEGAVSVPNAAAELARQVFTEFSGKTAMLVGAGDTAVLAAQSLIRHGVGHVIVANRTVARAEEVAEQLRRDVRDRTLDDEVDDELTPARCPALLREGHGSASQTQAVGTTNGLTTQAIGLGDIPSTIGQANLVLCSTGATDVVLTREGLNDAFKRIDGPVCIVDIAVPRDVDPDVAEISNVLLYNIDDLNRLVDQHIDQRRQEIPLAEAVVAKEQQAFLTWLNSRQLAPTIELLHKRVELLRRKEIKRYGRKFDESHRAELEEFTRCLCNKILNKPLGFLHRTSKEGGQSENLAAIDAVREMFDLDSLEPDT